MTSMSTATATTEATTLVTLSSASRVPLPLLHKNSVIAAVVVAVSEGSSISERREISVRRANGSEPFLTCSACVPSSSSAAAAAAAASFSSDSCCRRCLLLFNSLDHIPVLIHAGMRTT